MKRFHRVHEDWREMGAAGVVEEHREVVRGLW